MYFSKIFHLCLSLFAYTTAASPVDFSTDIPVRDVSAPISTRNVSFHDFRAHEAGLSVPPNLQGDAGSLSLGVRSLFHRTKPVRCVGGSGHFCEKNCACTKGGSVSCEKLSKAEIKKFKTTATDDEKSLEEHAQQITDKCAGVCGCNGGKLPGTKVRKIGFQIGYGDLKAAAYHVTEKDTRAHPPVSPVVPYGAPPGPPDPHSNGPTIDPYSSGVESYTPSIQRRGNAGSDLKDSWDAGWPFYSKEQTPPSCKGSRPVCEGHCYCTSTGEFTCDRRTKSQRKTFGSGPAVPDAIREHALNVTTACEPWCECKGKGKDWVEGKTLAEFNSGVGRNRGSGNTKNISSADPTGLVGAGGGETAPENALGTSSVDRGHLRGARLASSPTASRDVSASDLPSTASHSFSLERRGGRFSKNQETSSRAVGYSALKSGPHDRASLREEPIKCKSVWRKKCEASCSCTTQGTVSCDRLPAAEVKQLESLPDSANVKLARTARFLKICKPVCGCKDRDGIYKIEGRTFEEWNVMIHQGYKKTPAPATGDSSPGGVRGAGTLPADDVSVRHDSTTGGSQALSSSRPATDNLPLFSPPSLDRPSLHPRGIAASADKETSPSTLEPSGRNSRSDTLVCSNKNGQKSFCEVRCYCTATGTVMCGKRTDWGTTAAVAQPGTEGCLDDCWCSLGAEKARGAWGTWELPGEGRRLKEGSDTPEVPSNRPDQAMRTPEPQQNMPLRPTPRRVPSSFNRQFPNFDRPRSGPSGVLQARSGIASKLKEKITPGQKLMCHDAVKEFCLLRYTCDATGMILERGRRFSFKGMCGGFPCVHTSNTETLFTIETCKSACTCMKTDGQGELWQIGNTGEFWGGFKTPAVRGPRRRIGPIHEPGEALPMAVAPSLSSSQKVGQSRALQPRGGVGEAIKKKFGPGDRRLVCEGAPKQFCQARYSCSKTGAMTTKCINPVHCVSLSTQDHSVRDCKAACLCFDFKNRKALRDIGSTGEQWGGLGEGASHQTTDWPEVGWPRAVGSSSASDTPPSQAALQRRAGVAYSLDGNILKARGDNTVQRPAHGARGSIARPSRLAKPPLDKNIIRALGLPYVVRSPRSHTASTSKLSKPPLDKNIAKALGYDPERYGVRGPRRPFVLSASFTKPILFGKPMKAGETKTESLVDSTSMIPITSSPTPDKKLPLGEIEDNSTPQRQDIQERGGAFSAGKDAEDPEQHTPDEFIHCSGVKADSCKKKCVCSAEGTVVCGSNFGPGIRPWVRGALLTTGENAQKKMTEQEAKFAAECAAACQCKVNGVFGFRSRKTEKLKLDNAEGKAGGIGRFRVDHLLNKNPPSSDASPKALAIIPSNPSSLQRRDGSDEGDTGMSSAPILGQHTLKNPVQCEATTKGFCENRCYCTLDGVLKCDSKETVEDLFVHTVHDNRRLYHLDLLQMKAKKTRYIAEVTGKCTQTCKCIGGHSHHTEPRKGLRKALSVIPSQTPAIQPRSGTDLIPTANPFTPAAAINPRSGTGVAKPDTTFPASSDDFLRPPPIVCRGPQQHQCEGLCYCSLRGIVKCNKVSTADEMHTVLNDPNYPHLHTLPVVQKTNLLTYYIAQRTTECVPSCSCDGGKEFGKHGELGWQFDATQRLARPDMWRSRSGSEDEKRRKNLASIQERSISILSRGESKAGFHRSSTQTVTSSFSSTDPSQFPKSLVPRGDNAPTVRQAYALPRTGAGLPSALTSSRRIVCRGSQQQVCDQHCKCSEDGKVVCNGPATVLGMLATLRDSRTNHMSAQEKSNALEQDVFHMERACVVACSCDGGRTFGKGRPGWDRNKTPSFRPPAARRRHSDYEGSQRAEANTQQEGRLQRISHLNNRLQGLPPPGENQQPRLQQQSDPTPHPFSLHRTDLPWPRPPPRTPSPPILPSQISPLGRPPPQRAQPPSPHPQSHTLFRPTPRYGQLQFLSSLGPQPLRPTPTRPLPWTLPPGHPLFRPQPQQQGRPPPPRPPPPSVSLEPWEQYQQQPQYRHIPQLLRPPQKRSLQPQTPPQTPQQPRPQLQPQQARPPQPEPVEPTNPLLPQAHTLHQQFLRQTQRQIQLRDQRSHILTSAHQRFPPTAPPRSPNHRRQLGCTLTCNAAYTESCGKRCYCTPEGTIACDTAKTRMQMEVIFTDPANGYFNKVTDAHKKKLERMHVRQVEMGCAEECVCVREMGVGGQDKGKGKGLKAKSGVEKTKGGGKGKGNALGGGLEGGRRVLVGRSKGEGVREHGEN